MREEDRLRELRVGLRLYGIERKEAASALYLSPSCLDKKLRGALRLSAEEEAALLALIARVSGRPARIQALKAPGEGPS